MSLPQPGCFTCPTQVGNAYNYVELCKCIPIEITFDQFF